MNFLSGIKRAVGMVFRRTWSPFWSLWRTSVPWYSRIEQIAQSSTVAVTVMWCARNFPEAPPVVWDVRAEDGQLDLVRDHPMIRLLRRPNGFYSGTVLWMATVTDWKVNGNAYWLKIRDQVGDVAELWWLPSWMVLPVGDPDDDSVFIAAYIYTPNNEPLRIDPRDIVHFRFGLDETDQRKGCSPLRSVLREVFTDDQAAEYTASILVNMGVPGVVISPDPSVKVDDTDIDQAKKDFDERFSGPRRGSPMVMKGATKVQQFGFSPEQLVLTEIRRVPEERVTAALGVPAIVVGLGAGLDRSTFTNMGEAQAYAYSNGLIPDMRLMADAVHWQLLTEYESDPWMVEFGFDLSKVRALQEDELKKATAWMSKVTAGVAMVAEARRGVGLPVDEERDNVFLRPANYTMVDGETGEITTLRSTTIEQTDPNEPAQPATAPAPPPQNSNGALAEAELRELTEGVRA